MNHIVELNRLGLLDGFTAYCLKNEKECIYIIRFKNSVRSREFLHLVIHFREYFERLQHL